MFYIWLNFFQEGNPISTSAERYLLVYMIVVLLIVTGMVVLFFVLFQKRKNKMILEKYKRERQYQDELAKSLLELQDQTLKNIGWELHDNVGQLLSVANMQLNVLSKEVPIETQERIEDARNVISESLKEVRALSKSLNSDVIRNMGLEDSIKNEIERFNKLKFVNASFKISGDQEYAIDSKDQIIIFRILQEFFSNSIKHSKSKNLVVSLTYFPERMEITAYDDGIGFDIDEVKKGSGLINIESRAKLINAILSIKSQKNEGVFLTLSYPAISP